MNCVNAKKRLVEWMDGDLNSQESSEMSEHIATCASCKSALTYERLLRQSLPQLAFDGPSKGFRAKVFSTLEAAPLVSNKKPVVWFSTGFGSALAASFAAWLVFSPTTVVVTDHQQQTLVSNGIQAVTMAMNHVEPVRIAFDSPRDFDDIELVVSVPDHVDIDGYPGERRLSWRTSIVQGRNVLTIPLVAKQAKPAAIIAQVKDGEKIKTFSINAIIMQDGNVLLHNRTST